MKKMIVFACIFNFVCAGAQKNYRVIYKRNDWPSSVTVNGVKKNISFPEYALDFNDSLSFFHIRKQYPSIVKTYGNDVYHHHAIYFLATSGQCYSGALTGKPKKQTKYLIIDSLKERKWITWESTKMILGYECKPFLHVNEKNDSLLIWYAQKIPLPYGPSKYIEFEGLVLEVYDQQFGLRWYAAKIEEIVTGPVIPKDAIIVTKEEFLKISRN
jgi:GLPGLI family protein